MASVAIAPPPPSSSHSQSSNSIHLRQSQQQQYHEDSPSNNRQQQQQPQESSSSAQGPDNSSISRENSRSPPKVVVKKEPSSPEPPRHRPSKLNLAGSSGHTGISSQTPRTAKGSLTMQDLGMACLSPGLNVTDTAMREQLERSMNVRNAQRNIIEARLHRNVHPKEDNNGSSNTREQSSGLMTAGLSSKGKKRPPSALSIVPPHHTQFANERIIQSAPLNQSFTVRRQAMNEARHERMANRLPPIADVVFRQDRNDERAQLSSNRPSEARAFFPNPRPDFPSPRLAPPESQSERPREYKSAEEAVQSMSGGREDLLPAIIHYPSRHQPPTPPSPNHNLKGSASMSHLSTKTTTLTIPAVNTHETSGVKRRRLGEFDRDDSAGSDNEANEAELKRRKKEKFLALMAEAFELLHS